MANKQTPVTTTAAPVASKAPVALALPVGPKPTTVPFGNACVPVHTQIGAQIALLVPGGGTQGASATYLVTVPPIKGSTVHVVGANVLCKVGKVAKAWPGQNPGGGYPTCLGTVPLQITLAHVPSPGAGCPSAWVMFSHTSYGYVVNIYPQGFVGCSVNVVGTLA